MSARLPRGRVPHRHRHALRAALLLALTLLASACGSPPAASATARSDTPAAAANTSARGETPTPAADAPARGDAPAAAAAVPAAVAPGAAMPAATVPAAHATGELLIVRGAAPQAEVVVLDVATGVQRVLGAMAGARAAAWSPSGARLAFSAPHDGRWAVGTVAADGSDLRWLAPDVSAESVCWDVDGLGLIVAGAAAPPPAAWSVSGAASAPDIGRPLVIRRVPTDARLPSARLHDGHAPLLSPDGIWLVVRESSDHDALFVLHRPSGSYAPLTSAITVGTEVFSRAGDFLYVARELGGGQRQIIGTPWPVLHWNKITTGEEDALPAPSPDGRTLAFVRTLHDDASGPDTATIPRLVAAPGRDEIFLRTLDGGAERAWPMGSARRDDESVVHDAQWSPDGTHLAVLVGAAGPDAPRRLLLLDRRDGGARALLDGAAGALTSLAWRPDASSLATPAR